MGRGGLVLRNDSSEVVVKVGRWEKVLENEGLEMNREKTERKQRKGKTRGEKSDDTKRLREKRKAREREKK